MRILYCAIDQRVPGTTGGSVHVTAVARGLAAQGHGVHALVTPGDGPFPDGPVRWVAMRPPLGARQLRWARGGTVRRLARALQPDVVIERYHNFGGEGISAGAAVGATTVLEVNAPVIDHPGSAKRTLDRLLLVEPMRRRREHICAAADLIVTPSRTILPPDTPPHKIVELEWGADTDAFRPGVAATPLFERPAPIAAVFAGAFRSWHGAVNLVEAIVRLRRRGRHDIGAVLVGDGPERARVQARAGGLDGILFTGAVPHAAMPGCLAAADIGVAPFEIGAHPPLSLGFYWSPLKIFEYMAAGLPVVAPKIDRIPTLVRHEGEGLLYDPHAPDALAATLERLADPALRQLLGAAARARAVREYSWTAHCDRLVEAIEKARP